MSNWLRIALCGGLLLSHPALAQDIPLLSINGPSGQEEYSVKMQVFLLMTALSLLPAMLLMVTSFTRIIIVLGILRQALGLQQSPPNKVLIGIAMTLTLFIMRPVLTTIHDEAYVPYQAGTLTLQQAMETASPPLKNFMLQQTRETDLEQILRIANEPAPEHYEQLDFLLLTPAFVLSELKTAFQIGFMLFIPFLIIDIVVASVLMAMGMMMLSPLIISLPFKLMIFVMVDGWSMTVGTLSASFG
ncbi:flagellar type III secretion system pore protein FliP [Photobacterium aphoticum]|uniref:Flagellar biosynthetic protein FliP n=1 Tax=Photobacterium aphoticum TaxID=754436 RepID=A0A0J1GLQ3_9GAMM|nr:flagellar type III secretion system pore protein FliP [Photobacterium aphoticum]KLV00638.1 flagellar biosynthesis protein flip [Photobacterium aphoticum]PSU51932.1 flagellar biosynthetic protein FliP [Photobacterium aphoticum]GHA58849.1 flagellar biosynthetic protein FliP [Photobacterium aphoticum]